MAAIRKLDEANLQAICDILGATDTGLTGSEIGRYLRECSCPDPIPQMTKSTGFMLRFLRNRTQTGAQTIVISVHTAAPRSQSQFCTPNGGGPVWRSADPALRGRHFGAVPG